MSLFAVDPQRAQINGAPIKVLAHGIATVGMLGLSCTPLGQEALEVAPSYLVLAAILFIVDHTEASARIRDGTFFASSSELRRALAFVAPMIYLASFAAPSRQPASPMWAFLLMGGVVRGITGYTVNRAFVITTFACGLGYHLLAAPMLTPLSIAAAALASALSCLFGVVGERMVARALAMEARARDAEALVAAAREESRRLSAAMSLHDGLSGLVFGIRAKLDANAPPESVRPSVRAMMQRARELLASFGGPLTLRPALQELAEVYGTPVEIEGSLPAGLSPLEAHDLGFSALELTANCLRHGHPERVHVRLTGYPRRSVEVRALKGVASSSPTGRGRGARHLALRAASWGGTYQHREQDGDAVCSVSWPAPQRHPGPGWLGIATPLAASAFGVLVWIGGASALSLGFMVTGVCFSGLLLGLGAQSLRTAASRVQTQTQRREQLLKVNARGLGGRLDETLAALEDSLAQADLSRLRAQLVEFSEVMQRLLSALESEPDQSGGPSPG